MIGRARLAPLPEDEWDDEVHNALAVLLPPGRVNQRDAGNLLGTLVHHPRLTQAYLRFNRHLLGGSTLPIRLREIVILRVVHRRDCAYLWSHHVPIAQRAGLSPEDIAAIRQGQATSEPDRAAIRAVDELDEATKVSDDTWTVLGRHLDDRQCMDLVFTVGGYLLLAMTVKTFGVEQENPE